MGYCTDDKMVRVDFFRESTLKWVTTEAVKWTGEYNGESIIIEEFAQSLFDHLWVVGAEKIRLLDHIAFCHLPFHLDAYPLALKTNDISKHRNNKFTRVYTLKKVTV